MKLRWLLPLLVLAPARADLTPSDVEGVWDMSAKQRKYAVAAVIRQPGKRYPSFWSGHLVEGKLTLSAERDLLGEGVMISSKGGFDGVLNVGAPKLGMEDQVPGGIWVERIKKENMAFSFLGFEAWKVEEPTSKKRKGYRLEATLDGRISVGGKSSPLKGSARFSFPGGLKKFTFKATATFMGADLGLTGEQAGPLELTVITQSVVSRMEPQLPSPDIKLDF
ncbi:MAG: hypothetical protein AAF492_27320 [Verrucomicrobiota bacterium]